MAKPELQKQVIMTSNGVPGACAAAAVLMKYPEAYIQVTSPRHLAKALEPFLEERSKTVIHICGLGISRPYNELASILQSLPANINITWYSGKDYESVKRHLSGLTKKLKHKGNAARNTIEVILDSLKIKDSAQTLLLTLITEEDEQNKRPYSELHRSCRDMLHAANRRFFFFGDDSLNVKAIRYLAGIERNDDVLDNAVEQYRESPDALYPLGSSKAMKTLRKQIGLIGPVPEPVLIMGPTGSGKELMAKALHVTSGRTGNFVAVNCAVLGSNPTLVEDRLFGHVRGAFTGADSESKGAFEEAHEGTLFLDEIGELPAEVQAQLLRVLEDKEIRPLGTMKTKLVDVRIVAATHKDLGSMVTEGKFREDLFYRINVLLVRVPPLCERLQDMKSIANHIVTDLEKNGYTLKLTKKDWDAIQAYDWPGNVRQFLNVLKRAAYLARPVDEVIDEEKQQNTDVDIELENKKRIFWPENLEDVLPAKEIYSAYVQHVLDLYDGNIMRTSRALEIAPNTLRKHIKQ